MIKFNKNYNNSYNPSISFKTEEILILIKKMENPRFKKVIKIDGVLNTITGKRGYLLEDNTYYFPKSNHQNFTNDEIVFLFGEEFLLSLDKSLGREYEIEKLLE